MPERIDTLVKQAGELTDAVSRLEDAMRAQKVSQRRLRLLTVLLAVVVLAVAGFAGLAWDASRQANSLDQKQRITCEVGNDSRTDIRRLWLSALDTIGSNPDAPPTAAQRKQVALLRDRVLRTYAPRDCTSDKPTAVSPTPTR